MGWAMKFTTKIILLVTGSIASSILIISAILYHDTLKAVSSQFQKQREEISRRLAEEVSYPLYIGNKKETEKIIKQYIKLTNLQGVKIINPKGKKIIKVGTTSGITNVKEIFFKEEKSTPFLIGEQNQFFVVHLGTMTLFFSSKTIKELQKNILSKILIVSFLLLILLSLISYSVADSILTPLRLLQKRMQQSKEKGEPEEISLEKIRKDEIGELVSSYNEMVKALRGTREKLKETYGELSRKDKFAYLGKISATVAHELKNPLGIIKSSAQLLEKEQGESELLNFIIDETDRLDRVVKEFLSLARNREPLLMEENLGEIIERAILIWETFPHENVRIENHCGDIKANIDKELFTQVITNLLNNSYEARKAGSNLNIKIWCNEDDKKVKLKIEDNGTGIKVDDIDKIFEPFFTTKEKGTGMGLAIVYDIIKKHGGDIKIISNYGAGTQIIITIPGAET